MVWSTQEAPVSSATRGPANTYGSNTSSSGCSSSQSFSKPSTMRSGPDLRKEPGHEVALDALGGDAVAGDPPGPCPERVEPGIETRTDRPETEPVAGSGRCRLRAARDCHLVALGREGLGKGEQGQDVPGLRDAADDYTHRDG